MGLYQVDLEKMCQHSLRTGNRRAVMRKGGTWFFDFRSMRINSFDKRHVLRNAY